MDIRILHHHEPGFGWSFDSPDIPGLIGGTDAYDPVEAERAARFGLECAAEEAGRPAPASVRFEHSVPAGAAAAQKLVEEASKAILAWDDMGRLGPTHGV